MLNRISKFVILLMMLSLFQGTIFMTGKGYNVFANNNEDSLKNLQIIDVTDSSVSLSWDAYPEADSYIIYWADKDTRNIEYKQVGTVSGTSYTFQRSTHVPHYFKVAAIVGEAEEVISSVVRSETSKKLNVQLEDLDRGLVAASTSEGIFLSWRLLAEEVTAYSDYGLRGTDFNIYRDGEMIATVQTSTNYLDTEGTSTSEYYVSAVVDGAETGNVSDKVTAWSESYYDLPLQKPEDGVTPAGESYTYSANDMSVGDVDGDGQYEFIVKWDPSNAKDVSQVGYTGNVYIDTYTFEGELLYRIDLGPNIRAGAHYTQFLVYDFDGDGKAEMMFKTAPGTKIIKFDEGGNVSSEEYITMPQQDLDDGYSNEDDYRMSSDDYYEHVVEMFMGWHEHEEVVKGNWPDTLEESFGIEEEYDYPLSREDAESLVDYFMDVYAPERSGNNRLRDFEGFILSGPEYLTVFEGETGRELETIYYNPGRHDDGLMWGDYAMNRIEPGNRVDRFLAGVAYLNGENPYAIFARGYYTRTNIVSYSWDGNNLQEYWHVDSGWTPMSNPFNDGPHGTPGTNEEFALLTTQGNHSISTADVDGDGKQEIIYGASTIDDDGTILYNSRDVMPEGSATPGEIAGLGHGDALHVADINPDRPGLEIFSVFEGGTWAPYGYALRDAETGHVIHGEYTGRDTGRGMIGDVNRGHRGLETWATDLRTADGTFIGTSMPGTNMNIKWSADMATQIVNGSGDATPTIDDWQNGRLLTADGTRTNNGTKGNPSLVADVFGDWREELLVRTEDSSAIRIYLSTEETDRKLHTLMHDIQYRTGIAWQNTVYNQPAYPSYYFASDIDWKYVNVPNTDELEFIEEEGLEIDVAELEELIQVAKAISNNNESYTEVTFQMLQDAIEEAEIALGEIIFQHQLYAAIEALQFAIDGLEEIVDLGPGWRFDFGSANSPVANGYLQVTDTMNYDAERGYGFADGTDGFRDQEGPDDLRRDFILANGSEFIIDLPNGEYDVKIITGSNWNDDTAYYTLEDGERRGGIKTDPGEFMEYKDTVIVEDGQLNIAFSGTWARINGLEIVAVEDFNIKFDFGSLSSPVAYGYNQVTNTMLYDEERGYGLNKEVDTRDRGEPDDLRRDFIIDSDYQFMVDLRNGNYMVKIIAGDEIASNKSMFTIEGEEFGSISSPTGEYGELEGIVTVSDGQLNIDISDNGRINALEIYYVPVVIIDTTALEELITEAKSISNEDALYTDESFEALQLAIEVAELSLETVDSEEGLQVAIEALNQAISGLINADKEVPENIDTTALEELITEAKSISNEDALYTDESFEALQLAIEVAEMSLETVDSEEGLQVAIEALNQAISGLINTDKEVPEEIDTTELENLISEAKEISNADESYTAESFEVLQNVIESTEAVLETVDSEEGLTAAIAALQAAIDGLVKVEPIPDPEINIAELEKLITEAKSYSNADEIYTTDSFTALQQAIEVAESSLETINSEEGLEEALAVLQLAIDGLEKVKEEVEEDKEDRKDVVNSSPTIINGQATVSSDDIARLAQDGQFVIDITETDEVEEIFLTSDQVRELINKNANIVITKSGVVLSIPALHLNNGDEDARITIKRISEDDVTIPKGKELKGNIFKFTIMQKELISEFTKENPVTLEFAVDENDVKNTDNLHVFYLDEETGEWQEIDGKYTDGSLIALTTHFSIFAPMETVALSDDSDPVIEEPEEDEESEDTGQENKENEEDVTKPSDQDGDSLPKTATSMYTILLIGLILTGLGVITFMVMRRSRIER